MRLSILGLPAAEVLSAMMYSQLRCTLLGLQHFSSQTERTSKLQLLFMKNDPWSSPHDAKLSNEIPLFITWPSSFIVGEREMGMWHIRVLVLNNI